MKCYTINLDLPPNERWTILLNDYKEHYPRIEKEIDAILNNVGYNSIFSTLINAAINNYKDSIMYYEELVTISKVTNIPFDKLLIMQLMYEMSAACTTCVSNDKVMYRTMDWPMLFLKDITVELEFTKHNKSIFKATSWVGYVGIFTGMNYEQKYSVAVNYRRTKEINFLTLISNAISAFNMKWPVGYMVREVLSNNLSYYDAKNQFSYVGLISPTYITMCGKDECCQLTRDADKLYKEVNELPLVQTNVDCDKTQPDILYSNNRRKVAKEVLYKECNYNVGLSVFPIINEETIYCNVIDPINVTYYTTIKDFN